MKKIPLVVFAAISLCTTTVFSHSPSDNAQPTQNIRSSSESASRSASQVQEHKKRNIISKWLFQKEPAHPSESYERGVYRVRDRK